MNGQAAGDDVRHVREGVQAEEERGREHDAAMLAGTGSRRAEGGADVTHEVDVQLSGVGHRGGEVLVPAARRREHPEPVRDVEEADDPGGDRRPLGDSHIGRGQASAPGPRAGPGSPPPPALTW